MNVDLDREAERAVLAGRFLSAQEFIDIPIEQFLIAREFGEEQARKLATLRVESQRADEQIDADERGNAIIRAAPTTRPYAASQGTR
jgi:hypothetical protein